MNAHDEAEALIRRADDNAMRGEGSAALVEEAQRLIGRDEPEVDLHEIWLLLPQLADALEEATRENAMWRQKLDGWLNRIEVALDSNGGRDLRDTREALRLTELECEALTDLRDELTRVNGECVKERDDATAALREERINAEGLRERLAEAEKLAAVRDIALGRLREMADECEAANAPPGGQQVRLRRMTVPPSIVKELRWIADEGNAKWTYEEVRKVESRAKAAEERLAEVQKEIAYYRSRERAANALVNNHADSMRAIELGVEETARRALGRPE